MCAWRATQQAPVARAVLPPRPGAAPRVAHMTASWRHARSLAWQDNGAVKRTVDLLAREALYMDDPPLAVHLHDLAIPALHSFLRASLEVGVARCVLACCLCKRCAVKGGTRGIQRRLCAPHQHKLVLALVF